MGQTGAMKDAGFRVSCVFRVKESDDLSRPIRPSWTEIDRAGNSRRFAGASLTLIVQLLLAASCMDGCYPTDTVI